MKPPSITTSAPDRSRRRFLGGLAAAAVAPLILPSRAWPAANERLTVGIIGTGKMALGNLARQLLRSPGVVVAGVCDVDSTRRNHALEMVNGHYKESEDKNGVCTAYNDFRELIARDDIDAVVIVTPDHWHVPLCIAAARAGKDIYCEKPLTHTVAESVALMKVIHETGVILQTGSQQRSGREFRVACELVHNGVIGEVGHVLTSFGDPGRWCDLPGEDPEPGLDWNMWLGPAQERDYSSVLAPRGVHDHFPQWRNFMEFGGGQVADWGAHHLDIAQWGLGMDGSNPVRVEPPAEEGAKRGAKFIYANGVELTHGGDRGVEFIGSDGTIVVNRGRFELFRGEEREFVSANQLNEVEERYLPEGSKQLYRSGNHMQNWFDCIKSREQPICGVDVGARSALACHLMNLAYLHHAAFDWDPVNSTFANGTGDAAWLTKEYRDGWGDGIAG